MGGGGHHGAATALMVDGLMSEMRTGGQAEGAREHWLGVRMGEEHTAMHGRALRMPLLQPGSTTVSFCYKLGLGKGGLYRRLLYFANLLLCSAAILWKE